MGDYFNSILNKWFVEILENVNDSQEKIQNHKKTRIGKNNKKTKLRKVTDITFTYYQNRYPNQNPASVVSNIISDKTVTQYCITDMNRATEMLQMRESVLFKKKDTPQFRLFIADFRDSFFSFEKFQGFLKRKSEYKDFFEVEIDDDFDEKFKEEQLDFLSKVHIPPKIRKDLQGNNTIDRKKLIKLIIDSDLKTELQKQLPNTLESRKNIDQFLVNRVAGVGTQLSNELQRELQQYFPDVDLQAASNSNKCILSLFYNIKKALSLVNEPKKAKNLLKMKLVKGLDRTKMNPQYKACVRTERAKFAAHRAIHMYSSGLKLIQIGKKNGNLATIVRGYSMIYNIKSDTYNKTKFQKFGKHRKNTNSLTKSCPQYTYNSEDGASAATVNQFRCDEFRMKECASSAVLIMYMELMDYSVNPSPPLILKADMRVTAPYVTFGKNKTLEISDFKDVQNFQTWTLHKKQAFKKEYKQFLLKYMNVGFTVTDKLGIHGMPLLNLDDWGPTDAYVVANPFRVREDTFLFKYFGHSRLEQNRLGIGYHARRIWAKHTIKYNYDPSYTKVYAKVHGEQEENTNKDYPRPIFDINYYKGEHIDDDEKMPHSLLYFNVSSDNAIPATKFRMRLNNCSIQNFVRRFRNNKFDPPPHVEDSKSLKQTREFKTCLNIHLQMNNKVYFNLANPTNWQPSDYQLFVPLVNGQGSQENPKGWEYWRKQKYTFFSSYRYAVGEHAVPTSYLRPAPSLYNRFLHPVLHEIIPVLSLKYPELTDEDESHWRTLIEDKNGTFKREDMTRLGHLPDWIPAVQTVKGEKYSRIFPYPLQSFDGTFSSAAKQYIFPTNPNNLNSKDMIISWPESWDLRYALNCLMSTQALKQLVEDTYSKADFKCNNNNYKKPPVAEKSIPEQIFENTESNHSDNTNEHHRKFYIDPDYVVSLEQQIILDDDLELSADDLEPLADDEPEYETLKMKDLSEEEKQDLYENLQPLLSKIFVKAKFEEKFKNKDKIKYEIKDKRWNDQFNMAKIIQIDELVGENETILIKRKNKKIVGILIYKILQPQNFPDKKFKVWEYNAKKKKKGKKIVLNKPIEISWIINEKGEKLLEYFKTQFPMKTIVLELITYHSDDLTSGLPNDQKHITFLRKYYTKQGFVNLGNFEFIKLKCPINKKKISLVNKNKKNLVNYYRTDEKTTLQNTDKGSFRIPTGNKRNLGLWPNKKCKFRMIYIPKSKR
jgi:hypothetical protein